MKNSELLKTQTLQHHQQLEKVIIGKIKGMQSVSQYLELLYHFYAFFGGLEDILSIDMITPYLSDYSERRKTASLENDILKCNGALPAKAKSNDLPKLPGVLEAMGAIYVIEGSSLGGQIISQMICKQINLTYDSSLTYFTGYGAATMDKWLQFKLAIDTLSETSSTELVQSANETFRLFEHWISSHS